MRLIGDYYKPDLLLVPIGGHFVMSPQDAAMAPREWLKPKFGGAPVKVFPINPGDTLTF